MDELVAVTKKLKLRDYEYASVILDFLDKKVIQAHLDGKTVPKDWQKVRDFYHQYYAKVIDELESTNKIHSNSRIVATQSNDKD